TVTFQVRDAPATPVSFDNFPWFTDAELADALRQAVGLFDGTSPEQGGILDGMAAALENQLASRGIRARVEHTLLAEPVGDGMMQQFKVVGASLKIGALQFGDALANESSRVQSALQDLVGKPYSRLEVEVFTNEQVRPLYLARGHLRARIGRPQARFAGDPNRPLPDSVVVAVSIEPGPVYRWGGVEWQGNAAFGPAALNEFLELKREDLADGMKIAASWHRIEDEYGRRGYLDIKLKPEPVYDEPSKHVSYRATIEEGRTYRMGELVITGLSLAGENKVREAWRLPQGQAFDRVHFEQFLAMLRKGGEAIFGELPVHYEQAGHWLRANPAQGTVDVLLDFK
ncbi:MAG TPA: POTRA domain-containing protein, partial [Candidatus Acidoferrales bacterium]|nr:POTRA domain-containing protein [Candidatus Acidoferrales bacterium]